MGLDRVLIEFQTFYFSLVWVGVVPYWGIPSKEKKLQSSNSYPPLFFSQKYLSCNFYEISFLTQREQS